MCTVPATNTPLCEAQRVVQAQDLQRRLREGVCQHRHASQAGLQRATHAVCQLVQPGLGRVRGAHGRWQLHDLALRGRHG
jgi:hypothetical protein